MMHKKTCEICGGIFYSTRKNAATCSVVCREKRRSILCKENHKKKAAQINAIKDRQLGIDKINEIARSQGLSYGRYKAIEYMKNNNI